MDEEIPEAEKTDVDSGEGEEEGGQLLGEANPKEEKKVTVKEEPQEDIFALLAKGFDDIGKTDTIEEDEGDEEEEEEELDDESSYEEERLEEEESGGGGERSEELTAEEWSEVASLSRSSTSLDEEDLEDGYIEKRHTFTKPVYLEDISSLDDSQHSFLQADEIATAKPLIVKAQEEEFDEEENIEEEEEKRVDDLVVQVPTKKRILFNRKDLVYDRTRLKQPVYLNKPSPPVPQELMYLAGMINYRQEETSMKKCLKKNKIHDRLFAMKNRGEKISAIMKKYPDVRWNI